MNETMRPCRRAVLTGVLMTMLFPTAGPAAPRPGDAPPIRVAQQVDTVVVDSLVVDTVTLAAPVLDAASQVTEARLDDVWTLLREKTRSFLVLLPVLAVAFAIVLLFGLLAWGVGRWRPRARVPGVPPNPFLSSMVRRLTQFALVLAGLILALELLDATALVGAVVGTAGLAGLAIGFAFKDIVENYLAGIILSLRQPFAKSDLVDIAGHLGKVVRLTGRETILMTPDGNHVQIPNATVFREPMLNYSRNPLRRVRIDVGIAAEEEPSAALDVGVRVLREMQGVLDEPKPDGLISGYGNGTTELRFFGWVDQRHAEFGRVQSEAFRLIKRALDEAGVMTPSPEYRVAVSGPLAGAARPEPAPATGPGAAARQEGARPEPGEVEGAEQRDVSVDRALDEQIEEDRRKTDEENLLQ